MTVAMTLVDSLFSLVFLFLRLYVWAVILTAVFSMLIAFNVLDTRNRLVWSIGDFLNRVTEPSLRPIRRVVPNFGNIDLSPLIVIAVIELLVFPLLGAIRNGVIVGQW